MRFPVKYRQPGGPNYVYLLAYKDWLDKQPVAASTTRAYYSRVKQFLVFLEYADPSDTPLNDLPGLNNAISQYLNFLKQSKKDNSTVNANVNALKNFSQFLGLGEVALNRERCYEKSTKVLTQSEQERFLQAVEMCTSTRDKALVLVLFYTGLRLGDCTKLNTENVGAGAACISLNATTKIFLNQQTMLALRQWLQERQKLPNVLFESGLWLTKQGQRLQSAGVAGVIERLGWQAKLLVSVETIRRTWLTRTSEELNKDELVSKFGGYISKAAIKRYGAALSIDPVRLS